ncbi:MAG: enoyl-CoA hydratase-related protein [Gammaproteobacteria bacterium]|nr:enoyl-CoA hydratase-related protein [Gammaproteobacteria bacterium]
MSEIIYEVSDPVATITLNRPERMNAMTNSLFRDFRAAIDTAAADPDVVGIVVTGTGRAFSAGLDTDALAAIAEAGSSRDSGEPQPGRGGLFSYLTEVPKPIIAAVNGVVAGGGYVLATMCDLRIGSPAARFTSVFSKRGLVAEHGVTWTTPRLVGLGRAMDLLWTSRMIDADEAYRIGLLEFLADDPVAEARRYIEELAKTVSPTSMADTKRMVWDHAGLDIDTALDDVVDVVSAQFGRPDIAEGVNSFLEKRPPAFPRLGSAEAHPPHPGRRKSA